MPEKKKPTKKAVKPAVQSAGPGMVFSKESFFMPNRGPNGGKVAAPLAPVEPALQSVSNRFSRFEPQRRYVYDKVTCEAYAEWINNVAVCVHTGEELFRSREFKSEELSLGVGGVAAEPFDFSVPKQRHPSDYSVSTDDIIASGFLSLDAFKAPDGAAVRLVGYERFLRCKREEAASLGVEDRI